MKLNHHQFIYTTLIFLTLSCFVSCEKEISIQKDNISLDNPSELTLELAYPTERGVLSKIDYEGKELLTEKVGNEYVFQGDIILEPSKGAKGLGRSIRSFYWPNNTVFYTIDSGLTNQKRVTDAIAHWESNTNLRFVERTTESNYIDFVPGSGCSSNVGMIGGRQLVRLSSACSLGTTIHEIGHAVGLWHEQSKVLRDDFIEINYNNIQNGRRFNFDTYEAQNEDGRNFNYGIDFESIMMYHPCSFAKACLPAQLCDCSAQEATITENGNLYSIQRNGLSNQDIRTLRKMYPIASPWLTNNANGLMTRAIGHTQVEALRISEVGGYGVVSVGVTHNINIPRIYGNRYMDSSFEYPYVPEKVISFPDREDIAIGIMVKEQYGFGIIDMKLIGQYSETSWATGNNNEDRILSYIAPEGMHIRSFQMQEQEGYGIVDIRAILENTWDWNHN